jgi:hypothetical protein
MRSFTTGMPSGRVCLELELRAQAHSGATSGTNQKMELNCRNCHKDSPEPGWCPSARNLTFESNKKLTMGLVEELPKQLINKLAEDLVKELPAKLSVQFPGKLKAALNTDALKKDVKFFRQLANQLSSFNLSKLARINREINEAALSQLTLEVFREAIQIRVLDLQKEATGISQRPDGSWEFPATECTHWFRLLCNFKSRVATCTCISASSINALISSVRSMALRSSNSWGAWNSAPT